MDCELSFLYFRFKLKFNHGKFNSEEKMQKLFIKVSLITFSFIATTTFVSCENATSTATDKSTQPVVKAVAVLEAKDNSGVEGTVTFTAERGGVRIVADVFHLTPGKHGFHVHEHGDCSAHDASSAGGHFNPYGQKHGGPGNPNRHAGDLGNLVADETGHAHYDWVDDLLDLNGPNAIIGRSVVVHANEDDLTSQPAGNSGPRIACGVIE
jgi:Cu/Zn superoxide dismutase